MNAKSLLSVLADKLTANDMSQFLSSAPLIYDVGGQIVRWKDGTFWNMAGLIVTPLHIRSVRVVDEMTHPWEIWGCTEQQWRDARPSISQLYGGKVSPAPELPAPELPAPELPAPELPAPELPAPELPAPELPAPELPAPGI